MTYNYSHLDKVSYRETGEVSCGHLYRENKKCMVTLMRIGYWTSGLRGLTDRSDKCDRYLQLEATLKAAR